MIAIRIQFKTLPFQVHIYKSLEIQAQSFVILFSPLFKLYRSYKSVL
jgi:hypothetical protein